MIVVKLLTSLWLAFFLSTFLAVIANMLLAGKPKIGRIKAVAKTIYFAAVFPVLVFSKKGRDKTVDMISEILD